MIDGGEIGGEEIRFLPMKLIDDPPVLAGERRVGDGPAIRIDVQGNLCLIKAVHRMMGQVSVDICLQVAGRADLEENILLFEITQERRVFRASHAMADPGRVEVVQRLPNAFRSGGFPGVRGTGDAMGIGVPEGGDMGVDGKTRFVGGDVEADDVSATKFLDELHGFHALFLIEVPEGAEDDADLDAGAANAFGHGTVDGRDDLFAGEALTQML